MPKIILLLLPLLVAACAQTPKKEYKWVSLSEKGYTANSVKVLKETKEFHSDGGFENLEIKKQALPDRNSDSIRKIIFIGDTGCRLKENKNFDAYQNCSNPRDWGYSAVMNIIAPEKPDLIVHLGDYHYREQCSEGKICRQYTTATGYGWKAWDLDFFTPSEKGFAAAPWIFLRGNHEDCKRAFAGYKLLTEQKWDQTCIDHEETEYIQIGDLLIVQMDSTTLTDKPESAENVEIWEKKFKDIEAHLKRVQAKHVWLVTHRPVLALVRDKKGGLETTNINLQKAFLKTGLNKKIHWIIGGHVHNTQYLKAANMPLQIVVGNSGTFLDDHDELKNTDQILKHKIAGFEVTEFFTDTLTAQSFGYAVMTKSADNKSWNLEFKDLDGKTTFSSSKEKN